MGVAVAVAVAVGVFLSSWPPFLHTGATVSLGACGKVCMVLSRWGWCVCVCVQGATVTCALHDGVMVQSLTSVNG